MMYVDFTAGNKEYKLRLSTRNTVALEKKIGCNPLAIFGSGESIPTVTTMVYILFYSLQQYNHSISFEDTYDIFERWLEDGNTTTDFINVIVDIYKVSGIMKDKARTTDTDEEAEGEEKNE